MRKEEYSKVMAALDLIHKEVIASLDEEIYSNLTNLGGLRGIYHHSAADIVSYAVGYYGIIDKCGDTGMRIKFACVISKSIELRGQISIIA
jgi:hypothetical protein